MLSPAASPRTILDHFLARVHERPDAPAARVKRGGRYESVTWAEMAADVEALARGLLGLGAKPGDRVVILSHTRIEWTLLDLAIQAVGAVSVPIYPSSLAEDCRYLIDHSDASVAFVEDAEQVAKLREVRAKTPGLRQVVLISGAAGEDDPWVMEWGAFRSGGEAIPEADVQAARETVGPEDMFTIIYTSGTTGRPKGVVLTHGNMLYEADAIRQVDLARIDDVQLLFLPLAHVFARVLQVGWLAVGNELAYAESFATLKDNIAEVRPTVMAGVPRVYEKFYAAVVDKARAAGGLQARLFEAACALSKKRGAALWGGAPLSPVEALAWAVLRRLVFRKIGAKLAAALGGHMRAMLSGGAPLSLTVGAFFEDAGLPIMEGYGLTETSAGSCVGRPDAYKIGTVGKPLPGTEVRVAADGELLIRGPGVMREYWKDPEATAEALEDGWFHTGDIGEIDRDGFVRITDRKKDLIVTAGGKNVAPQKIENLIGSDPLIARCIVFGDRRKYLVALLTLDADTLASFARERGLAGDPTSWAHAPEVEAAVADIVARGNAQLASYETIKRWAILGRDLTVEDGELTPKLSVRRKVVAERYGDVVDSLYDGGVLR